MTSREVVAEVIIESLTVLLVLILSVALAAIPIGVGALLLHWAGVL